MINLWFLWFLQKCHRNCWELKLAIVHFRQPRLESLTEAVWTLIELCFCQSLLKPGASQLVYRAAAYTMERRRARRKPVSAVRHWRRMPDAIAPSYSVCKRSSRLMSMLAVTIVRPIASKSAIALTPRIPHS